MSLQGLEQAIDCLYNDPDPAHISEANVWLDAFQHTNDAWAASWSLIQQPDTNRQYFGALILHSKIRRDWGALDVPSRDGLRTAVLDLAGKAGDAYAAQSISTAAFTKIALALCSCIVQSVPDSWPDVIKNLIGKWTPPAGSTAQLSILFEVLRLLPEEFDDMVITQTRRDMVREELLTHVQAVLSLCHALPNQAALQTALSWVKFSPILRFHDASLAGDGSFGGGILGSCFVVVEKGQISDAYNGAVDLLEDILRRPVNPDVYSDALRTYAGHINALIRHHSPHSTAVPRIASAFARGQVVFMCGGSDEAVSIISFLTECAAQDDVEVADGAFVVFSEMYARLHEIGSPHLVALFSPIAARFIVILVRRCVIPNEIETIANIPDEFQAFRQRLSESLLRASELLGPTQSLDLMQGLLGEAIESGSYRSVESVLEGMVSISSTIPTTFESPVLSNVFGLISQFPDHTLIRHGTFRVAGAYGRWLSQHSQHMFYVVEYAIATLASSDLDTHSAAAKTLGGICKVSAHLLAPHFEQLCSVMQFSLDVGVKSIVVEALSWIAVCLDAPIPALCAIIQEPLKSLAACITENATHVDSDAYPTRRLVQTVVDDLQVMSHVFQVQTGSQATLAHMWPTIERIASTWPASPDVVDALCGSLLCEGLKTAGVEAAPMLQSVLQVCVTCAGTEPNASCLRPVIIAARTFGVETGTMLGPAIATICKSIADGLRARGTLTTMPDVTGSYYDVLDAVMHTTPLAFGPGGALRDLVPDALQLAIMAISGIADAVAVRSIAGFCSRVIDTSSPTDPTAIDALVAPLAATALLAALTVTPRSAFNRIADLLFSCFGRDMRGCYDACMAALARHGSDEKERVVKILASRSRPGGLIARSRRKYRAVVTDAVLVCTGQLMADVLLSHEM